MTSEIAARRLRDGADFLDMCARADRIGDLDWSGPILERKYTISETMRDAAHRIETLDAALEAAGTVYAAEVESLQQIILKHNQLPQPE